MKLLLASDGDFVLETGYSLLDIPPRELKIGYVTTASKGVQNKSYIEHYRNEMIRLGYSVHEIDIEGKTEKELYNFFKDKNVMHVEGGNPFCLLKAVKETGFDKVIKKRIAEGIVYIGVSAGAYIACPTIEVATWRPKERDRFGLTDFSALNLVPFLLKAHYTDDMQELVKSKIAECKYPVRILRDGQGILVGDGKYAFVGEGMETKL